MTCYKCGKELPPDAVSPECEDDCRPSAGQTPNNIVVQINLNEASVAARPEKFDAVMKDFLKLLEKITIESGLHEFARPKP